jgi:hypothetical protein
MSLSLSLYHRQVHPAKAHPQHGYKRVESGQAERYKRLAVNAFQDHVKSSRLSPEIGDMGKSVAVVACAMQLVSFEVFVLPIFFHKILEDELT